MTNDKELKDYTSDVKIQNAVAKTGNRHIYKASYGYMVRSEGHSEIVSLVAGFSTPKPQSNLKPAVYVNDWATKRDFDTYQKRNRA